MAATFPLTRRQFLRASATSAAAGAATGVTAGWGLASAARAKGASGQGEWGDLVGRFLFEGPAPKREKLKVDKDLDCCGKFDIRDESLLVDADGGLANVFLFVRSRNTAVHPDLETSAAKQVLLDNRDCIFIPHCMTIWVGRQELSIVNSDPVAQNVAFSPLGDAPANIVLPAPPDKASKAVWKFKRKQRTPIPIACNYHPWESAFILPLDHPYCAISAKDGTFRIGNLPVGPIELQAWHERTGPLNAPGWKQGRVSVTVQPGPNDLGPIRLAPSLFPSPRPAHAAP